MIYLEDNRILETSRCFSMLLDVSRDFYEMESTVLCKLLSYRKNQPEISSFYFRIVNLFNFENYIFKITNYYITNIMIIKLVIL